MQTIASKLKILTSCSECLQSNNSLVFPTRSQATEFNSLPHHNHTRFKALSHRPFRTHVEVALQSKSQLCNTWAQSLTLHTQPLTSGVKILRGLTGLNVQC